MVAFDSLQDELAELGVEVMAASIDMGDASKEVAEEVSFKIGEGVTRDQADLLGAWYGDARHPKMIQPSEFLGNVDG